MQNITKAIPFIIYLNDIQSRFAPGRQGTEVEAKVSIQILLII